MRDNAPLMVYELLTDIMDCILMWLWTIFFRETVRVMVDGAYFTIAILKASASIGNSLLIEIHITILPLSTDGAIVIYFKKYQCL